MWKKIAIGCMTLIVAISVALFWQVNRAKTELAQYLNAHQITFTQLFLNFFPQPYLELNDAKWHDQKERSVFAEKVNLQLNFSALFNPKKSFKQFTFQQAQFWYSGQAEPDLKNVNGQVNGELFVESQQVNLAHVELKIVFDTPILFNTKQLQIAVQQGVIKQLSDTESHTILDDVNINGEEFTSINATLLKNQDSLSLSSQARYLDNRPELQVDLNVKTTQANQQIIFTGKNIALAQWQKIFNLPRLFVGDVHVSGEIMLNNSKVQHGNVEMQIPQGQFEGINLLALVAKYLPINYDEQTLKEKKLITSFQNLHSRFSWDTRQLLLKQLDFTSDKVTVAGKGQVNLTNMQCEIMLNLGLAYPQYQQFKLPIRFFDHCYSPQYKVEFNKQLRNQLKDLLKEKFK